jgi:hypothetical protein
MFLFLTRKYSSYLHYIPLGEISYIFVALCPVQCLTLFVWQRSKIRCQCHFSSLEPTSNHRPRGAHLITGCNCSQSSKITSGVWAPRPSGTDLLGCILRLSIAACPMPRLLTPILCVAALLIASRIWRISTISFLLPWRMQCLPPILPRGFPPQVCMTMPTRKRSPTPSTSSNNGHRSNHESATRTYIHSSINKRRYDALPKNNIEKFYTHAQGQQIFASNAMAQAGR